MGGRKGIGEVKGERGKGGRRGAGGDLGAVLTCAQVKTKSVVKELPRWHVEFGGQLLDIGGTYTVTLRHRQRCTGQNVGPGLGDAGEETVGVVEATVLASGHRFGGQAKRGSRKKRNRERIWREGAVAKETSHKPANKESTRGPHG